MNAHRPTSGGSLVLLGVLLAGLACLEVACSDSTADRPYERGELELDGTSLFPDGLMLFFLPDQSPWHRCAGANVEWIGSDLNITFIRQSMDSPGVVQLPAQISSHGRHSIFVSDDHVPRGTSVRQYVTDGTERWTIGGYRRLPIDPEQADVEK